MSFPLGSASRATSSFPRLFILPTNHAREAGATRYFSITPSPPHSVSHSLRHRSTIANESHSRGRSHALLLPLSLHLSISETHSLPLKNPDADRSFARCQVLFHSLHHSSSEPTRYTNF